MKNRYRSTFILRLCAGLLLLSHQESCADEPPAEQPPPATAYEVHHWGVWLADPGLDTVNSREQFTTGLPLSVETSRPRRLKHDKKTTAPINVVTFRGPEVPSLEVDARVRSGGILAHWPTAKVKNNRLRWLDYRLAATAPENAAWASASADHWFVAAREDAAALVLQKGARSEKFLTYDLETNFPMPLKLGGGPDSFELRSTADYPLHDVMLVDSTAEGRRIGWLDVLPAAHDKKPVAAKSPAGSKPAATEAAKQPELPAAPVLAAATTGVAPAVAIAGPAKAEAAKTAAGEPGPPVQVTMSKPVAVDGDEWVAQSTTRLIEHLGQAGLSQPEIHLLMTTYEPAIFRADSLTVTWRMPAGVIDELNPLTFEPEPSKTVRVVLVVARNLDPTIATDLQKFVDELGNKDYKLREAAGQRLNEYGSLAYPVLKKALTSPDPEVAFRAEKLLLDQHQSIDVPAK